MAQQNTGIYQQIEEILRASGDTPLTCVDIFDSLDGSFPVRDANRVSDFLGHMWRRGLLQRWYAPKDVKQKSRYAYTWKGSDELPEKVDRLMVVRNSLVKPNVTITEEENRIVLDFAEFTLTIQAKQ